MSSSAHPSAAPASILTVNLPPTCRDGERFGIFCAGAPHNPSETGPLRPSPRPTQPQLAPCPPPANRLNEPHAPVAQLDRALPSEGKGHTFESCRVRQQYQVFTEFRGFSPPSRVSTG